MDFSSVPLCHVEFHQLMTPKEAEGRRGFQLFFLNCWDSFPSPNFVHFIFNLQPIIGRGANPIFLFELIHDWLISNGSEILAWLNGCCCCCCCCCCCISIYDRKAWNPSQKTPIKSETFLKRLFNVAHILFLGFSSKRRTLQQWPILNGVQIWTIFIQISTVAKRCARESKEGNNRREKKKMEIFQRNES